MSLGKSIKAHIPAREDTGQGIDYHLKPRFVSPRTAPKTQKIKM